MSLQQALVTRLEIPHDARYAMTFRWGRALKDIPQRVGHNQALDAAVGALLARHTETSQRQDQTDPQAPAAREYYRAVAILRANLGSKDIPPIAETCCTVMLLTYCQVCLP